MFHNYSLIKQYPLSLIVCCICILLICYHARPLTYQGKQTVSGLFGIVVGVLIATIKLLFERD
ncbi:hypothetical protein GO755_38950 [Spirosoma sp. HMF4905]|uniref:Uncharacterized protein n=1 Tax=Spirosoma arboris TaxID=2682092 RepID=A0A7K1SQJ7_9BACT|nr:hypothetical protein [Spirosoma arboris]MVM36057.1 hypothetical protein [Spirosoma arboris]